MNRRHFLHRGVAVASVVGVAGCSRESLADFTTEDVRTTIETSGNGEAMWTWSGEIIHRLGETKDVEVSITLFDEEGAEITTVSKILKDVDGYAGGEPHEVSYVASLEIINRIYNYELSVSEYQTET